MDTAHQNNVGATFRSPVVRLAGGLKPAPTLIVLFFFLLPWQTRWIFSVGASEYATIAVTVVEVIFWLLVVTKAPSLIKRELREFGGMRWIVLFLAFAALSLLWSSDRTAGTIALIHLVEGILLFVILRSDDKLRQLSVRAFLFGMLPAAALGIYQFLTQHIAGSTILGIAPHDAWMAGASVVETSVGRTLRAYGPFPHPNIFGGYLVVAILLIVIARRKSDDRRSNLIWLSALPIFSAALVATFSRSAWVGLTVGIAAVVVSVVGAAFRPPTDRGQAKASPYTRLAFLVVSIVIPFVLALALAPDLFRARLTGTGRLETRSTIERTTSLRAGFDDFTSHPLFGNGIGVILSPTKDLVEPPHNFFLALAADLGLLGLALFLIASLRGVRRPALPASRQGWPAGRRSNLIRLPIVTALFMLALFDHYLWTLLPGAWLFWWVLTVRED